MAAVFILTPRSTQKRNLELDKMDERMAHHLIFTIKPAKSRRMQTILQFLTLVKVKIHERAAIPL